jgi:hypothetical protein
MARLSLARLFVACATLSVLWSQLASTSPVLAEGTKPIPNCVGPQCYEDGTYGGEPEEYKALGTLNYEKGTFIPKISGPATLTLYYSTVGQPGKKRKFYMDGKELEKKKFGDDEVGIYQIQATLESGVPIKLPAVKINYLEWDWVCTKGYDECRNCLGGKETYSPKTIFEFPYGVKVDPAN